MSAPVPGFAEKLVGLERGVETEFSITLPDDYPVAEVVGKECHFRVTIAEIKERRLSELDDDFARGIGENFETLQELRQHLFSTIRERAEQETRRRLEDKIIEGLIDISRVDFPEVLVDSEVHRLMEEQRERAGGQLEEYLRSTNKTEEQLHEELHPVAEKRIRRSLILGKVAEVEDIKVGESDIEAEIERMAGSAGEKADEVRQALGSQAARHSIEMMLLTRKTIGRLVDITTQVEAPAAGTEPETPPE